MKKVLSVLLQTVLLLFVYAVGFFTHPFHVNRVLASTATQTRTFNWDGLLLMLFVYVILLGIAAVRKRLPTAAPWTTLALVLATALALAMKLGFVTHDLY